jgi:hypothetical protein
MSMGGSGVEPPMFIRPPLLDTPVFKHGEERSVPFGMGWDGFPTTH